MSDNALRPKTLDEIVGLEETRRNLKISIEAAKHRNEPLGHTLLYGGPGLGKTTLALAIAAEIGTSLVIANAATIKSPLDLHKTIRNIEPRGILFVDEVHNLSKSVEESLFTVMEDFRIDRPVGKTRTLVSEEINAFTFIGATTHLGKVSAPLRDRFRNKEKLNPYTNNDITQIVLANAKKLGCSIDVHAARIIAIRSRNTPRISVNLIHWCRDFSHSKRINGLTIDVVREAMKVKGIDDNGLNPDDMRYIYCIYDLFNCGPAGLNALESSLLVAAETIQNDIEPFLLSEGYLTRTPSGRVLTAKGILYAQTLKENIE